MTQTVPHASATRKKGKTEERAKENRLKLSLEDLEVKNDRIRFNCSNCHNRIKAQYGQEGRKFFCPFCKREGVVPYTEKYFQNSANDETPSKRRQYLLLFILVVLAMAFFSNFESFARPIQRMFDIGMMVSARIPSSEAPARAESVASEKPVTSDQSSVASHQ